MDMSNWDEHHRAIIELTEYLLEVLPTITYESSPTNNVFVGAVSLYRCNRYLKSIDLAVESDIGDTAGGNLRTLYETWILGHLLLLANEDEARQIWAMTIDNNNRVTNAMGAGAIEYPENAPEAERDRGVQERAQSLKAKLVIDDPDNSDVPIHCYDFIFRSESLLSSHANLTSVLQYAKNDDEGTIGLHGKNQDCEWRTMLGGLITLYFAKQLFTKAGMDGSKLDDLDNRLGGELDSFLSSRAHD